MSQQITSKTNKNDFNELQKNISDLNEIQQNLLQCISSQGEKIDTIEENLEKTHLNMNDSNNNLKVADKYFFNYTPIFIGSILGIATLGPLASLCHLNIAGIATIGGGMLGGVMGYKIQKI